MLFAYHAPFFRGTWNSSHGICSVNRYWHVFRRYWCRNICPMGAILALLSEWTIFKRTVSTSCTGCGLCVETCGMGAIESDGYGTKAGECILCMTCKKICPENSITFGDKQPAEQRYEVDLSKRAFLITGLTSTAMTPFLKLNYTKSINKGKTSIIRPPGAVDEKTSLHFVYGAASV